ncbi:MAG: SHOCT domain-containing protein [Halapricum sp.]
MPLIDVPPRSWARRWTVATAGVVTVLAVLTTPAVAQHGAGGMGGGVGGVGWFGLGPLLWVVLIGAVVALIAGYGRATDATATASRSGTDDALETLRERYARGELSEEAFERRRQRLLRDRQ